MNDVSKRRVRTREILAEICEREIDRVREGDRLREDLGLDSLQSLELLSVVSEELRINLPMEEAVELRTVGDACDFVETAWQRSREAEPTSHA
ncbi:MAG: acyl carrier protein [Sandaracinus sp.]